jgi:hypothetical protein
MLKKIILASFLLAHSGLFSGGFIKQTASTKTQPKPVVVVPAISSQNPPTSPVVAKWLEGIKNRVGDLKAQATIINSRDVTQRTITRDDFTLKSDLYDIVSMLQRMINPSSAIHKKLQKNLDGLAWYQRWFGLAPGNIYQYFEKFIFPLIQDAPIYQDLADQGVQILVGTYVDEIEKHIKIIIDNPKFAYGKPFTDALTQLADAFKTYNEFLLKNKELLPVGSYNKIASSSIVRSVAFAASTAGAGGAAAWKLGLDPRKIAADKARVAALITGGVTKKDAAKAALDIGAKGLQTATEAARQKIAEAKNLSWSEKFTQFVEAGKHGAQKGVEYVQARTTRLKQGWDLKKTKGLERTGALAEESWIMGKQAVYGKILAAVVASYIGYQTVKWLLKDWPRKKFTPSGQTH